MQGDIVAQGVELMLYGMSTVVVFLTLLVVVTTLMSALLQRFFAEAAPATTGSPRPIGNAAPDEEVVVAITAAVHAHRNRP